MLYRVFKLDLPQNKCLFFTAFSRYNLLKDISVQLYSVLHGSSYVVLEDGLLSIHSDKGYMLMPPQNCDDVKFAGGDVVVYVEINVMSLI